jgi:hypothetical protein
MWDQYEGLVPPAIGKFLIGTQVMYEDGMPGTHTRARSQACHFGSRRQRSTPGAPPAF